jgi:uncharacterized Zn-binding protein involved in type VI secretion
MTALPAAHLLSPTQHGTPLVGPGSFNVTVNSMPAWSAGLLSPCALHGPEAVGTGSETVTINGKRAAREGDFLQGAGAPNRIMLGSQNVVIGTPAIGTAGADGRAAFCALQCALVHDWKNLTPDQRKARYEALLGAMFARFGAPAPDASATTPAGSQAAFDQHRWAVLVPTNAWTSDTPPNGGATFHEIRHGEQTFMGARQRGAQDLGARQVPADVAAAAAQQPLDPNSPEGRYGSLMADEYFTGAGNAAQSAAIRELGGAFKEGAGSARYAAAFMGYYERPTGQDAKTVEDAGACGGCP